MFGMKPIFSVVFCLCLICWVSCAVLEEGEKFELKIETNFGGKSVESLKAFEIKSKIGKGSYGCVTSASMTTVDSNEAPVEVAIKTAIENEDYEANSADINREIQVYNMLDNAPGFATFLGSGVRNNNPLLVLEKFESNMREFREVCPHKTEFDRKLIALDFIIVGIKVLRSLYEKKIVHRDLKLGNFVLRLDDDGSIYLALIDFGLSHLLDDGPTGLAGNNVALPLSAYANSGYPEMSAKNTDLEGLLYVSYNFLDKGRWDKMDIAESEIEKQNFSTTLKFVYSDGSPVFLALNDMLKDVRSTKAFDFHKHLKALKKGLKTLYSQKPLNATYKIGSLQISPSKKKAVKESTRKHRWFCM